MHCRLRRPRRGTQRLATPARRTLNRRHRDTKSRPTTALSLRLYRKALCVHLRRLCIVLRRTRETRETRTHKHTHKRRPIHYCTTSTHLSHNSHVYNFSVIVSMRSSHYSSSASPPPSNASVALLHKHSLLLVI